MKRPKPPSRPKGSLLQQVAETFSPGTNPPTYEQKYYLHGYPQLTQALELFVAGERAGVFDAVTTFDLAKDLRGTIDNDDRRTTLGKLAAAGGSYSLKAGEYLALRDAAICGFNTFEEHYRHAGSPAVSRKRYSSRMFDGFILVGPFFAMAGGGELASQLDYIPPDARNKYLLLVTSALAITSAMRREFKRNPKVPRFKNLESFGQPSV